MKLIQYYGFFLLLISLNSCVGLHLTTGTNALITNQTLASGAGQLRAGNCNLTKAEVIQLWGKPKRVKLTRSGEAWIYRDQYLKWRGLTVFAIIPLPVLLIPTGHYRTTLEFQGEQVKSIRKIKDREYGAGFFWSDAVGPRLMIGPHPFSNQPNP